MTIIPSVIQRKIQTARYRSALQDKKLGEWLRDHFPLHFPELHQNPQTLRQEAQQARIALASTVHLPPMSWPVHNALQSPRDTGCHEPVSAVGSAQDEHDDEATDGLHEIMAQAPTVRMPAMRLPAIPLSMQTGPQQPVTAATGQIPPVSPVRVQNTDGITLLPPIHLPRRNEHEQQETTTYHRRAGTPLLSGAQQAVLDYFLKHDRAPQYIGLSANNYQYVLPFVAQSRPWERGVPLTNNPDGPLVPYIVDPTLDDDTFRCWREQPTTHRQQEDHRHAAPDHNPATTDTWLC